MNKKNIVICPCENTRFLPINKCCNSNNGTCLIVPVSLRDVCKNKHLLVIVEVYKDNNLYARQIKKVFTGCSEENNCNYCCSKCSNCDDLIDCLFIDDFEFYFLDICNPKCIYVDVKIQYLYDC